jgi:hypothetical protein
MQDPLDQVKEAERNRPQEFTLLWADSGETGILTQDMSLTPYNDSATRRRWF